MMKESCLNYLCLSQCGKFKGRMKLWKFPTDEDTIFYRQQFGLKTIFKSIRGKSQPNFRNSWPRKVLKEINRKLWRDDIMQFHNVIFDCSNGYNLPFAVNPKIVFKNFSAIELSQPLCMAGIDHVGKAITFDQHFL